MADTDVNLATLKQIAGRLQGAVDHAEGLAAPPPTPNAGKCTGALAAVLSGYSSTYADLIGGLAHSGSEVRSSHASFADTERGNVDSFHQAH